MHYSGILVVATPRRLDDCRRRLAARPGLEVHYCEPERDRLIVVQETADAAGQERGLRWIQSLPEVAVAALVEHRIDIEEGTDGAR
jgi:nitrate reductase NapAB chaperone NapD